ncbi:hypothetical protein INR49_008919 [Caranx melampygus]|nr:hypothetical protein INR49_008919 [Caranx melampygus]
MSTSLLLLLSFTSLVFAKEQPDLMVFHRERTHVDFFMMKPCPMSLTEVNCVVVHLQYINCSWNKPETPRVNYTFQSQFATVNKPSNCSTYISENGINTGCLQPFEDPPGRFITFHTILSHDNKMFKSNHSLKDKVMLNPPVNLTVQNGSDFNLWFYWNQTKSGCVESEVRFRTNNNKWEFNKLIPGKQDFCINLPSSSSRYELQVRSKIGNSCGESKYWSNWSEPVVWGSNNSTVRASSLPHRLRIIPIPVPKKLPVFHNIEDWLQYSKGLKGDFKANYNEHACPVREYCPVESDSESSDGSAFSVTTDQTDCSVSIMVKDEFNPDSSSSSSSDIVASPQDCFDADSPLVVQRLEPDKMTESAVADTRRLNSKPQDLTDAYGPPSNFLEIDVYDPQIVGVGRNRYTTYEVRMRTNLPIFKLKDSCVRRRYSDFEWLKNELERDSKVNCSTTSAGQSLKRQLPFRGDEGLFEESFIEERRSGLEQFINRIAGHPLAQNERCLHMFLQEESIDRNYIPGKVRH